MFYKFCGCCNKVVCNMELLNVSFSDGFIVQ